MDRSPAECEEVRGRRGGLRYEFNTGALSLSLSLRLSAPLRRTSSFLFYNEHFPTGPRGTPFSVSSVENLHLIHLFANKHMHTHTHTHARTHRNSSNTHTQIRTHTHINVHIHAHTDSRVHTHTHTHSPACTHTHTQAGFGSLAKHSNLGNKSCFIVITINTQQMN